MWLVVMVFCAGTGTGWADGIYLMAYLTANELNIATMKPQNEDGNIIDYYFYDGQPTDFECHKIIGNYVMLSYVSKAGANISTELQPALSVKLFMKLTTAANNGTFLECIVADEERKRRETFRVRLVMKVRDNETFVGFEVNGMIIALTKKEEEKDYYVYKYYEREPLTIKLVYDEQFYEHINCESGGPVVPYSIKKFKGSDTKTFTKPLKVTLRQGNSQTSLNCSVRHKSRKFTKLIVITFVQQTHDYSPYIGGLSIANVLTQYSNNTLNVIQYKYIGNEKLLLSCEVPSNPTKWSYMVDAVTFDKTRSSFQLAPHTDRTTVKCIQSNSRSAKRTFLELVRLKEVETVTTKISPNENDTTDPGITGDSAVTVVLAICGAVLVVATVVVVVTVIRRKRKHEDLDQAILYSETLQAHNGMPTQLSVQWSGEYAAPVDSVDSDTYSVPYFVDNSTTPPQQPSTDAYSVPYSINNSTTPRQQLATADVTYADLQFGSEDSAHFNHGSNQGRHMVDNYVQILRANETPVTGSNIKNDV